jgi:hypothetical protein
MDALSPLGIGEVWPVVLVETRSVLQNLRLNVKDRLLLILVQVDGSPRDSEQLVAHSQETTERENGVCHLPAPLVEHDFLDLPKVVPIRISYLGVFQ